MKHMRARIANPHRRRDLRYACPLCGARRFGSVMLDDGSLVRMCHGGLPETIQVPRAPGWRPPPPPTPCSFAWHIRYDPLFFVSPGAAPRAYPMVALRQIERHARQVLSRWDRAMRRRFARATARERAW